MSKNPGKRILFLPFSTETSGITSHKAQDKLSGKWSSSQPSSERALPVFWCAQNVVDSTGAFPAGRHRRGKRKTFHRNNTHSLELCKPLHMSLNRRSSWFTVCFCVLIDNFQPSLQLNSQTVVYPGKVQLSGLVLFFVRRTTWITRKWEICQTFAQIELIWWNYSGVRNVSTNRICEKWGWRRSGLYFGIITRVCYGKNLDIWFVSQN